MSNPFDTSGTHQSLGSGAWGANVQTTFMPERTVPAVPGAGGPMGPGPGASFSAAPPGSGQVPAVPQAQQQGAARMPFMNSTAVPSATGRMGPGQGQANGQGPNQSSNGPPGGPPGPPPRDTQPLLQTEQTKATTIYPFYNIRRYRPYFDIDTREVLWRVANSFIGAFRADFMSTTQQRPDLYGPFWIATTLIFVTAVAGNYSQYIQWRIEQNKSTPPPLPPAALAPPSSPSAVDPAANQWFNDYTKLAASAGIFYGYVFVLSLILWLVMRYLRSDMKLVNMFCIYGYAMTIYIPVSLICIIPISLMQWLLVMGSALSSGMFLLMNMRERIMPAGAGKAVPMLILTLLLHLALGLALKLYFFSY